MPKAVLGSSPVSRSQRQGFSTNNVTGYIKYGWITSYLTSY